MSEAGATGVSIRVSFVATHALTAGTDSVTLDASTGYVFPADSACGQYNVTDLTSGADDGWSPLQSGAGTNEVTVAVPNVAAGDQVRVAVDGVTNPSAKGRGSIAVSTSEDTAPVSMATTIVKAASVGNLAFTTTSAEAGATGVGYRLSFVSTSGLSEPDNGTTVSTITVEAPANVVFPADSACYQYNVTDEATGSEDGCAPLQSGSGTNEITLATPNVSPGDQVLVFIDGITGAARKGSGKVTLWTTSDPKPTDVKAKTVASAWVGQPDLTTSADGADYQVGFVATAGLSQPDNGVVSSTITLDAATGTEFPADSSCSTYIVTDLTNGDREWVFATAEWKWHQPDHLGDARCEPRRPGPGGCRRRYRFPSRSQRQDLDDSGSDADGPDLPGHLGRWLAGIVVVHHQFR